MADQPFNIAAQISFDDSQISRASSTAWQRTQKAFNQRPIKISIQDDASAPLGRITAGLGNFDRAIDASTKRVLAFAVTAQILSKVEQGFKGFIKSTLDVQDAFNKINIGMNLAGKSLDSFQSKLFDTAKNTGKTFTEASQAALLLSRQGLGAAETLKRLNDVLILSRDAGIDVKEAFTDLTAIVNTFKQQGLDTTSILDKLVAVHLKTGTSSEVFASAIERSGEVAQQAGVKFESLVAMINAIQRVTQRGGASIGTSLEKVFAGVLKPENKELLNQYGINTVDANGQSLNGEQIVRNLAIQRKNLSQNAFSKISESLIGERQEQNIIALLDALAKGESDYTKALDIQANSAGKAQQANNGYNASLKDTITAIGTSFVELSSKIGNLSLSKAPILSGAKDLLGDLKTFLSPKKDAGASKVGESIGNGLLEGISNILIGPGAALIFTVLGKAVTKSFQYAIGDVKGLIGINNESERRNALLAKANELLVQGTNEQRNQFLSATTLAEKTGILLDIDAQRTKELQKQAALIAGIAAYMNNNLERGVGELLGPRPKNFAGGFSSAIAAESHDIASGVGGASSAARPVIVPKFNFGGGRIEPVVANTDEYIVKNFSGGGGDAIFNKNMVSKYGLPSGAKHLASGYIRNFADGDIRYKTSSGQSISKKDIDYQISDISKYGRLEDAQRKAAKLTDEYFLSGKYEGETAKDIHKKINDALAKQAKLIEEQNKVKEEAIQTEKSFVQYKKPIGPPISLFNKAQASSAKDRVRLNKLKKSLSEEYEEETGNLQSLYRSKIKGRVANYENEVKGVQPTFGPGTNVKEPTLTGIPMNLINMKGYEEGQELARLRGIVGGKRLDRLSKDELDRENFTESFSKGVFGASFILPIVLPVIKSLLEGIGIDLSHGGKGRIAAGVEGATTGFSSVGAISGLLPPQVRIPLLALATLGGGALGAFGFKQEPKEGAFGTLTDISKAVTEGLKEGFQQSGVGRLQTGGFLSYNSKIGEEISGFGATHRLFSPEPSRNGGFLTPSQRAQSTIDFYKLLAGQSDVDVKSFEGFNKARPQAQLGNVENFLADFLSSRNPGGRYRDFRGNPIRGALQQTLQYDIGQNPKDIDQLTDLQNTYNKALNGVPKINNGVFATTSTKSLGGDYFYGTGNAETKGRGLYGYTGPKAQEHNYLKGSISVPQIEAPVQQPALAGEKIPENISVKHEVLIKIAHGDSPKLGLVPSNFNTGTGEDNEVSRQIKEFSDTLIQELGDRISLLNRKFDVQLARVVGSPLPPETPEQTASRQRVAKEQAEIKASFIR